DQGIGTGTRTVEDANLPGTGLQQCVHDATGSATGTEHRDYGTVADKARCRRANVADEAHTVGVVGDEPVAFVPERVGSARCARRRPDLVSGLVGHLLVRDGDIAADIALRLQTAQEQRGLVGLYGRARVAAGDTVTVEPIAVNERRARMGHGPA